MRKSRQMKMWSILCGVAIAAMLCTLLPTSDAIAQQRGGGSRMSPEASQAVWALQSKVVAAGLKLDEANAKKLADAYAQAHQSYSDAVRAAFEAASGGGGREGGMSAFMELRTKEADKFKAALAGFLTEAQVADVMKQLGGFDRSLDSMVNAIIGFKLDEAKTTQAVQLSLGYAAKTQAAMAGADREAMRTAMTEEKTKLDEEMAKILSAEQLATWKEETAPRSFGGRGGAGGGGGGGGGQRGGGQGGNQ